MYTFNNIQQYLYQTSFKTYYINLNKIIAPAKSSKKRNGIVAAYGVNTHQGLVRQYNEDRVSIILNIAQPVNKQNMENWPNCSFFGIYDGHGGSNCADFLKKNLHEFVIQDVNFPQNPQKALENAIAQCEEKFCQIVLNSYKTSGLDRSGSCLIAVLIIENDIFIANVGDSRAFICSNGKDIKVLTTDHKPENLDEQKRIVEAGGKIYQNQIKTPQQEVIYGPMRVFPGKLSVCRTIGDIEAKDPNFGGKQNVVSAKPQIVKLVHQTNNDFIIIGCDGIYDKLENQEISKCVWELDNINDIHQLAAKACDNIINIALQSKTTDNVTTIILLFDNFLKTHQKNLEYKQIKIDGTHFNDHHLTNK